MKHLWMLILALACGGEPGDFYVGSEPQEDEPADLGEDSDIGVAQQAFGAPLQYGFQQNTNGLVCTNAPGQPHCIVPRDKVIRPRVTGNIDFDAGFTLQSQFNLEMADLCNVVLNPRGWDCAIGTGSTNEAVGSGSCASGAHSCMTVGNINSQLFSQNGITYQQANSCSMKFNKAAIEAHPTYQAGDINGKKAFVRRALKHELGHCVGLPHSSSGVMSTDGTGSFTTQQLGFFASYAP